MRSAEATTILPGRKSLKKFVIISLPPFPSWPSHQFCWCCGKYESAGNAGTTQCEANSVSLRRIVCHSRASCLIRTCVCWIFHLSLTHISLPLHFYHLAVTINHLIRGPQDCLVVMVMCIVESGASLHVMWLSSLNNEEKKHIRPISKTVDIQTANGIVVSDTQAKVNIKERGAYLWVDLVKDSQSVLSLGRLCNELGDSYPWPSGETPRFSKGKKVMECSIDNFVPVVAVTKRKAVPSIESQPKSGCSRSWSHIWSDQGIPQECLQRTVEQVVDMHELENTLTAQNTFLFPRTQSQFVPQQFQLTSAFCVKPTVVQVSALCLRRTGIPEAL